MEFAASQRSGPAPQGPVPALSVVVVSYNMRRELPRTLCTLGAKYQQNVVQDDYEVILVDHGSLHQGVNGGLIECGVGKAGACIFMRGILKAYGTTDRNVWVACPEPAISLDRVQSYFALFDLLDEHVRFLRGWFPDTLPHAPIGQLAVLRLDGDLYSSTMDVLNSLYDKVSPGGFIIIDDYGVLTQCARATDEFRASHGIVSPLEAIDGSASSGERKRAARWKLGVTKGSWYGFRETRSNRRKSSWFGTGNEGGSHPRSGFLNTG